MADYTAQQLVDEARGLGHAKVSKRLVVDWVGLGLLDQPTRHPLGYGRGSEEGTWPEEQRRLFLTLLDKRREAKRVAALCNLPVWLWLLWGGAYVPLRQVRRALKTWGGAVADPAWGRAEAAARRLVDDWASPKASAKDRRALVRAMRMALAGPTFDAEALLPLVARVLDPDRSGEPRGPRAAQLTARRYVDLLRARLEAARRLDELDDALFEWARYVYLVAHPSYERMRPRLAADPEVGRLFAPLDVQEAATTACLTLVSILGSALVAPIVAPPGTLLHPGTWQELGLRGRIRDTTVTEAGIGVELEIEPEESQPTTG